MAKSLQHEAASQQSWGKATSPRHDPACELIVNIVGGTKTPGWSGPKPLTADEIQARKTWAWKMFDRASICDIEGCFRRMWLLQALLEDYFLIRGQWYRGPKEAFQSLRKNNLDLYQAFDLALQPAASVDDIGRAVQLVVGPRAGF